MYKILLADDEAEERKGISFLIKKYQYPLEVIEAVNGQKALDYIMEHPVDILFTDVKMPYKDGLTLAKEIYEYNSEIKIIIFSAYGEFEYAKKAMEANAVDYLLKPIELKEFQEVMERVLESIQKQRQEQEQQEQKKREDKRQNLLYRFLSGAKLKEKEQEELDTLLFQEMNGPVLLINLESAGNLFEQEEERFLQLLQMYFKEAPEYMNLYPSESFLVFCGSNSMLQKEMEKQLEKLVRDAEMVLGDKLSVILGRRADTMELLMEDIRKLREMRTELFGFPQQIFSLSDGINKEYYAKEVDHLKGQFMAAVKQEDWEILPEMAVQLVKALEKSNMVSRIYVEHLFYEILNAVYHKLPGEEQKGVYQSLHAILECRGNKELTKRFESIVEELILKLQHGQEGEHGVVGTLIRIIEKEYQKDISLDYLAGQVNMAPAYISYMFKHTTGETLVKYITDLRMERGRQLLEEGSMKIVQIGQACGYENQSYFNRLFKNYFGMTPKQYREQHHD